MKYIGIDLACSAIGSQPSAVAVLNDRGVLAADPQHFRKAGELVKVLSSYMPADIIIAVDAPRSVPDHTQENYAYRSCEKAIKKIDKGAGTFSGAAALYLRWYEIESRYFKNFTVIETYPRVVWRRLGFTGKPKDLQVNRQEVEPKLERLVGRSCHGYSGHQVDAVLSAYVAWCYGKGKAEGFGEPGEGYIFMPAITSSCVGFKTECVDKNFCRFPCMLE